MAKKILDFDNYSDDFIWNYDLHFPVPTVKYVVNNSGINVYNWHTTNEEAQGNLVALARATQNYIFRGKLASDALGASYLIATNKDLLYKVLGIVLEFVVLYYSSGSFLDLYKQEKNINYIPAVENAINGLAINANCSFYALEARGQTGVF